MQHLQIRKSLDFCFFPPSSTPDTPHDAGNAIPFPGGKLRNTCVSSRVVIPELTMIQTVQRKQQLEKHRNTVMNRF